MTTPQQRYRATKKGLAIRVEQNRRKRLRVRLAVLKILGAKCQKCKTADVRVLNLDHVNGRDGPRDRPFKAWSRALREGCPKTKYRLLCFNCNWLAYLEHRKKTGMPPAWSEIL